MDRLRILSVELEFHHEAVNDMQQYVDAHLVHIGRFRFDWNSPLNGGGRSPCLHFEAATVVDDADSGRGGLSS